MQRAILVKHKKEQLSPWLTVQENTFSQKLVTISPQQESQTETISRTYQTPNTSRKIRSSKKIQQIIRLKTQVQKIKLVSLKNQQKPHVRINRSPTKNLVNRVITCKQNEFRIGLKFYLDQLLNKKPLNQDYLCSGLKRNNSLTFKVQNSNPLANSRQRLDINRLKKNLLFKRNSSVQTLRKAKQQIQKVVASQQVVILGKYFVQTMRLNVFQPQTQRRQGNMHFPDSNSNNPSLKIRLQSSQVLQRYKTEDNYKLKPIKKMHQKTHVLDKLYDKYYLY